MKRILYLNPSGNTTAVYIDKKDAGDNFKQKANRIISSKKAEQVGVSVKPINGGDCRIDMAGGEFCGNAVRAFGYYYFVNACDARSGSLDVETSGAAKPLKVYVDRKYQTSFVSMPKIYKKSYKAIKLVYDKKEIKLPLILMDGISHVLVNLESLDIDLIDEFTSDYKKSKKVKEFIQSVITNKKLEKENAVGIMFVIDNKLYPYVEVRDINSKMWESSCGSGTTAYFAYLLNQIIENKSYIASNSNPLINGVYKNEGDKYYFEKSYIEPGGSLRLKGLIKNNKIKEILLGGVIEIIE